MKELTLTSKFIEYASASELTGEDSNLVMQARKCMMNAYAPYSQFKVGAALLLENGEVVTGSNQENASYPVGLCAERVALFAAGANYPGIKIKTIAITISSNLFLANKPGAPCGSCRQAIAEYEYRYGQPIRLIMTGESGHVLVSEGISNLLPLQFSGSDLMKK